MIRLNYFRTISLTISLLMISIIHVEGVARTLSAQLNPNCPPTICENTEVDSNITLLHVQATGENDTLHYIWDLNRQPSVLVALCDRNTNVTFNWPATLQDAVKIEFSPSPKYTMSFVLTKVFVFNDEKDEATIIGVNTTHIEVIDTKHLKWSQENYSISANEVQVTVSGENETLIGCGGKINLKLKCYAEEDHALEVPHLMHSINATQVDIEFLSLTSNRSFESPRVGAEFVLVASESPSSPFVINRRKTIDDEHSPGTFTIIDVVSPDSQNGTQGSYLQFRPISYTDESRDITKKTDVHLNEPVFVQNASSYLNSSLVSSFYGEKLNKSLVQSFNISFGQPQDKFYSFTNYTTWTFVIGYGKAPPEKVSMLIAILACIGLGIPLLLLISGGIYLAVKRMRNC